MDSNAPDHKPQATLDSQAICPQVRNPEQQDPSIVLFSFIRVDVCTFSKNDAIFMINSLKFIMKHCVISYSSIKVVETHPNEKI